METKRDNTSTILGMVAMVFLSIVLILTLVFPYVRNKTAKAKVNTRTINGTYSNGTIVTTDNNVWKVTNYNGISTKGNHKVSVKFDTKGTDSVLDDEIIKIKDR